MEGGSFYILAGLTSVLVILNVIASYIVRNTHFEVKERRTYQLIFVWLLPFIGAIFAIMINREDYFADRKLKKVGNNSNISETQAVNIGSSVGSHNEP